jgi:hypothetical protein
VTVTAARGAFSVRELACVLRENQKNANVFRTSGELWFKGLPSKKILQRGRSYPCAGSRPDVCRPERDEMDRGVAEQKGTAE